MALDGDSGQLHVPGSLTLGKLIKILQLRLLKAVADDGNVR
jgi:hypothetical protein